MLLTMKEQRKVEVVQAVMDRRISVEDGGQVLECSGRTVYRMLRALRTKGLRGLIHGNRGRASPRRIAETVRRKMVEIVKTKYTDVNDTHLQELLWKHEKILVGRSTLQRILRAAGVAPKQKRRRSSYRRRRERKEAFGMMLQMDASRHDWLEGRGPELTLVGAIDDATGFVWARFEDAETTRAYLHLMRMVFSSHGLPMSLYSDRHTIFHAPRETTIVEQLNHLRPLTQFGRAMGELGIRLIKAWSPQAKGRIERLWGTFQDRLVVELRLAGATTKEEANDICTRFLRAYNRRFTVRPTTTDSLFKVPPSPSQLDRIVCLKETRIVNKDHTISFEGLVLQIPPSSRWRSIAGQKVDVLQLASTNIEIVYKGMIVATFSPEAIRKLIHQQENQRSQLKYAA